MKMILSFLIFLSWQINAFAGGATDGGGGNAVVCFSNASTANELRSLSKSEEKKHQVSVKIPDSYIHKIEKVMMLDEWEMLNNLNSKKTQPLDFTGEKSDSYVDNMLSYTKRAYQRFELIHEGLYKTIKTGLAKMPLENWYSFPATLPPAQDHKFLLEFPECVLSTIIYHQDIAEGKDVTLYIDKRFFEGLPEEVFSARSKGIALVHEAAFIEMRHKKNHSNSRAARKLTGLVVRKDLGYRTLLGGLAKLGFRVGKGFDLLKLNEYSFAELLHFHPLGGYLNSNPNVLSKKGWRHGTILEKFQFLYKNRRFNEWFDSFDIGGEFYFDLRSEWRSLTDEYHKALNKEYFFPFEKKRSPQRIRTLFHREKMKCLNYQKKRVAKIVKEVGEVIKAEVNIVTKKWTSHLSQKTSEILQNTLNKQVQFISNIKVREADPTNIVGGYFFAKGSSDSLGTLPFWKNEKDKSKRGAEYNHGPGYLTVVCDFAISDVKRARKSHNVYSIRARTGDLGFHTKGFTYSPKEVFGSLRPKLFKQEIEALIKSLEEKDLQVLNPKS